MSWDNNASLKGYEGFPGGSVVEDLEIPWTEELGGLYNPQAGKELDTTKRLSMHAHWVIEAIKWEHVREALSAVMALVMMVFT